MSASPAEGFSAIDVLGIGTVAVDDILFLPGFPRPDSKLKVLRRERHTGGLCGTALVAAQRMGGRCAYAGCLGEDELSVFVLERLTAEGISVEHVVRRKGARPYYSTILVDTAHTTRTILFDPDGVIGADPNEPQAAFLRFCKVLLVDQAGVEGMVRAAHIVHEAGIPVVADIERAGHPLLEELSDLSDHLIVPLDYARSRTGMDDPGAAARGLWSHSRSAVVVTCGGEGSWYLSQDDPGSVYHQPAFRVDVVDTNGCGDVFHGVYAASLAEGKAMVERIRIASAVAAIKATKSGGQQGIPTRPVADSFLREHQREAQLSGG